MAKYFIYFSFTGNGDYIAELMHEKGYEPVKLELVKKPNKIGFWQILKYGGHAGFHKKEKLAHVDFSLEDGDEIVFGSPIWNDRLSTPITTFMDRYNFNKETTKFVLYPAGSNSKNAIQRLQKMGFLQTPIVIVAPLNNQEAAVKALEL